jgi:hypothetical protein
VRGLVFGSVYLLQTPSGFVVIFFLSVSKMCEASKFESDAFAKWCQQTYPELGCLERDRENECACHANRERERERERKKERAREKG